MSTTHKRAPRLGRGLSSLMGQPVQVLPPIPVPAPGMVPTSSSPGASVPDGHVSKAKSPENHPVDTGSAGPVTAGPAWTASSDARNPKSDWTSNDLLTHIPLDRIVPSPYQPRQDFDPGALERLAQSIKADGVMQPVLVRPPVKSSNGESETYELIAGERRWRAAKIAGLTHIPALIRSLDNRQVAEFALIENLQREDLNPLERAHAFNQLMERFNLSHDQIAERVGVERSTISNSLRLLTLCKDVQELIRQGLLSAGQAKALAGVSDPQQQALLAAKAVRGEWSVRQVESAVRNLLTGTVDPASPTPPKHTRSTHLADLEVQIGQQLGTKVRLRPGRKKGSGSLTIEFYSLDQFDALMTRLGVRTE